MMDIFFFFFLFLGHFKKVLFIKIFFLSALFWEGKEILDLLNSELRKV